MSHAKFSKDCLEQNNIFRRLHCVKELTLSHDLEKSAQSHAEHLLKEDRVRRSARAISGEVGEILSMRSNTSRKFVLSGSDIVQQWYATIKDYNFTTASGPADKFTQLIWASTTEVGFGFAQLKSKYVVVAHYSPPGNVKGHYETNVFPLKNLNEELSSTADLSTLVCFDGVKTFCGVKDYTETKYKCEWTDNLRLFQSSQRQHRTESMSSDEDFELKINDMDPLSMAFKRRNRQFVRDLISSINKHRVLHGVPILKHNPCLDKMSREWARKLAKTEILAHSGNTYKGVKVGENVCSRWSNAPVEYDANEVATDFYNEYLNYTFDVEPDNVKGFGNFTQMMWRSTKEIGIGRVCVSNDKDYKVIIVCNFYPAGNVLGRFIENVLPQN